MGILPEDYLVISARTDDDIIGSGRVKGDRLLTRRGRDCVVSLHDKAGRPAGQVTLSVGGGSISAVCPWDTLTINQVGGSYHEYMDTYWPKGQYCVAPSTHSVAARAPTMFVR